jgi:hypothetical protein
MNRILVGNKQTNKQTNKQRDSQRQITALVERVFGAQKQRRCAMGSNDKQQDVTAELWDCGGRAVAFFEQHSCQLFPQCTATLTSYHRSPKHLHVSDIRNSNHVQTVKSHAVYERLSHRVIRK